MKRSSGFTLTELLTVVAIAAVLAAIGAPGMGVFLKNNRLRNVSFEALASLNYARSEAVTRKLPVIMCRSDDPALAPAAVACATSGSNAWNKGWLVFADADGNLSYDDGTDTLLRQSVQTTATVTVTANATAANALRFLTDGSVEAINSSGTATRGAIASLYVCDERADAFGREAEIAPHGRARLIAGSASAPITACPG